MAYRPKAGDTIYPPAGQAGEYAPLACNPYRGCGHACVYCYVPAAIHMKRREFDMGAVLRENFMQRLQRDAKRCQTAGVTEQVMLSFTSDPYHPGDTLPTREVLQILIEHGMGICTLTKGGMRATRDLDLFRPTRDAFATTLTTLDDEFSLKWERHAPLPSDRIAAMKAFHRAGIFVMVSLEPVLNIEHSLAVVDATHRFVDYYKCGRANYCGPLTKLTDWSGYTAAICDRMQRYHRRHYIKHDLQAYLPEGYHNPLRIAQHHA